VGRCHFVAPIANRRAESFERSCGDITKPRQKRKTYRSVLGTIFFGGFRSPQIPARQALAQSEYIKK
jgi:hypothetical protein